jgi:hypothetical protein
MTTERSRHLAAPPRSPTRGRSSRAPGLLGRHEVDLILLTHFPRRRPRPRDAAAGQQACTSLGRQVPTQAVEEPVVDTAGDDEPGDRGRALPAPPPPSTTSRSDTADTGAHGHRTLHPGHRTADTRTLRRPHRTLDSARVTDARGRWTLRTPDAGRGRGHSDEGTAGILHLLGRHAQRRRLGRPTVFLGTALAALGNRDGSAGGPHARMRLPLALPRSCSAAPAKSRLGALLSCVGFGWYEWRATGLRKVGVRGRIGEVMLMGWSSRVVVGQVCR